MELALNEGVIWFAVGMECALFIITALLGNPFEPIPQEEAGAVVIRNDFALWRMIGGKIRFLTKAKYSAKVVEVHEPFAAWKEYKPLAWV